MAGVRPMSEKKVVSLRLDAEKVDKYDAIADQTRFGRSEVLRQAIEVGIEQMTDEDDRWQAPEHIEILDKRQELIKKNRVENLKGGFRNRIYQQFKTRFKNNWSPDEIELVVDGYRDEIELLFADKSEKRRLNDFIDHLLSEYRVAYEKSDYNPFEGAFEDFTGVKEGTDGSDEQIVNDWRSDIQRRLTQTTDTMKDVVDDMVTEYPDLDRKRAVDIVEAVMGDDYFD